MNDWQKLKDTLAWLGENGPNDPDGDWVDAETAKAAQSFLDLAEFAEMKPPKVFWHGGDAVVFTWGEETNQRPSMMITISGKSSFHVHYPRNSK